MTGTTSQARMLKRSCGTLWRALVMVSAVLLLAACGRALSVNRIEQPTPTPSPIYTSVASEARINCAASSAREIA
jgi:hypothetical protein